MTKPLTIIGLSSLFAATILGFIYYGEIKETLTHNKEIEKNEISDYRQATLLLKQGRLDEALKLIQKYEIEILSGSSNGDKWLDLLIAVSENLADTEQLLVLFNFSPNSFKGHEKGSLLVASALLAKGNTDAYDQVRSLFKNHEKAQNLWFNLDADRLVIGGKPEEATKFLSSRYFEGKEDAPRLLRLALVNINDHPKTAWTFLEEALNKDPESSDLRLFRARLLETTGKKGEAYSEYINAIKSDPLNRELADNALNFLIGERAFDKAVDIVKKNLSSPANSSIWVKALFIDKAIRPISYPFKAKNNPNDDLVKYLVNLNPDEFWNSKTAGDDLSQMDQTTFWLRTIQNIKEGREKDAYTLLTFNPYEESLWDPVFATALKRILTYRASHTLELPEESPSSLKSPTFFRKLEQYATEEKSGGSVIEAEDKNLLLGKWAFVAAMLANNWNEAAIRLIPEEKLPNDLPKWVVANLAFALKQNRGLNEAIAFLEKQNLDPKTELLLADLYIQNKTSDNAIPHLENLLSYKNDIGDQATEKLARIYYEQGKYQETESILSKSSPTAPSVIRNELLGKTYLKLGNSEKAIVAYSAIENDSIEAKSYLAKVAYTQKNWNRALELTETLLKTNPQSSLLQENKQKILNEIKKAK